jgi:hypothetical protein
MAACQEQLLGQMWLVLAKYFAGNLADFSLDGIDRAISRDNVDRRPYYGGFLEKPGSKLFTVVGPPAFDPVESAAKADQGGGWVHVQQKRAVRLNSIDREGADAADLRNVHPAGISLINDVRQEKTITDHRAAGGEGRANHLVDQLSARGHVQQHLTARTNGDPFLAVQ